jgi:hypothetical protein
MTRRVSRRKPHQSARFRIKTSLVTDLLQLFACKARA